MTSRSAEHTIKGYLYQFNETLTALLNQSVKSRDITIEGIEDYDIDKGDLVEAHQCKYHETQKFYLSTIRKPLSLMLSHHAQSSSGYKYYLRVHFKDRENGEKLSITLKQLKEVLTYKIKKVEHKYWEDNKIQVRYLKTFLSNLEVIFCDSYDDHKNALIRNFAKILNCNLDVAENYYYPKALSFISDKSIKSSIQKRKTNKQSLLAYLNSSSTIFDHLFLLYKGKEKFISEVSKKIKRNKSFMGVKEQFVFIDLDAISSWKVEDIVGLIMKVQNKYYRICNTPWDAVPWAFVLQSKERDIVEIKKSLIRKGIKFEDGRESLHFNQDLFNAEPLKFRNGSKRLSNSSYMVKILSWETYQKYKKIIKQPEVVFAFAGIKIDSLWGIENAEIYDMNGINDLSIINQVLLGG